jgi:tetratricopeptide (TPR) repeat protein
MKHGVWVAAIAALLSCAGCNSVGWTPLAWTVADRHGRFQTGYAGLFSLRAQAPDASDGSTTPSYNPKVEALICRAMQRYRSGDLEAARTALQAARRINPYASQTLELEAQIAIDLGDEKTQLDALNAVLVAHPNSAQHQSWAGQQFMQIGQTDRGLTALKRAVALAPRNVHSAQELAAAYLNLGESARAVEVLAEALRQNPIDKSLAVSLARLQESRRQWESAAFYYEFALKFEPQHPQWRWQLARVRYRLADYQRAYDNFVQCADEHGFNVSLPELVEFGDVCLRAGDYGRAQHLFDELSRTGSEPSPEVEALRALCALNQGQHDLARETVVAALRSWPDDATLRQISHLCETIEPE